MHALYHMLLLHHARTEAKSVHVQLFLLKSVCVQSRQLHNLMTLTNLPYITSYIASQLCYSYIMDMSGLPDMYILNHMIVSYR